MKKIHVYGIVACSVLSVASFSACTRSSSSEQIVSEQATPLSDQAGIAQERTDTEVKAKKETVKKETKTLEEDVPSVVSGQTKFDVNKMNAEDFVAIGLDRDTADRVIQHRDQNGPFSSITDLSGVQGVSQSWLNQYRERRSE